MRIHETSTRFQCTCSSTSTITLRSTTHTTTHMISHKLLITINHYTTPYPFPSHPNPSITCSTSVRTTSRRITFSSSRTLPGHVAWPRVVHQPGHRLREELLLPA